jgi:TRAP-type C4-dicarboxylate transport system permease small subunit
VYFMYKAYSTAGGGIREILGDLPKSFAYIALLLAASLIAFVALLRCITRRTTAALFFRL